MISFIKAAVFLVVLQGASCASVFKRESEFYYPYRNNAVNVQGANGGQNYGGNGANGGTIDVNAHRGSGTITAIGANGGTNFGNGPNGGRMSANRREEEKQDFWRPNSPVSGNGVRGSWMYGPRDEAVTMNEREEGKEDFFFRPTRHGAINAKGANGGENNYGNGANGGRISIGRRGEEAAETSGFFLPFFSSHANKNAIRAYGVNGGYNYYGNGANGGSIDVN